MVFMSLVESVKTVLGKKTSIPANIEKIKPRYNPVPAVHSVKKLKPIISKKADVKCGFVYIEITQGLKRRARVIKQSRTKKTVLVSMNTCGYHRRKFYRRPTGEVRFCQYY